MKKFIHQPRDVTHDPFKTRAQVESRKEVVETMSDCLAVTKKEQVAMILRDALMKRFDLQTCHKFAQELEQKLYMDMR